MLLLTFFVVILMTAGIVVSVGICQHQTPAITINFPKYCDLGHYFDVENVERPHTAEKNIVAGNTSRKKSWQQQSLSCIVLNSTYISSDLSLFVKEHTRKREKDWQVNLKM